MMTETEQLDSMKKEIDKVINRYSTEFDVSVAGAIGVLEMLKFDLYRYLESNLERKNGD